MEFPPPLATHGLILQAEQYKPVVVDVGVTAVDVGVIAVDVGATAVDVHVC